MSPIDVDGPTQGPTMPIRPPSPLSKWEREWLDAIVSRLTRWRADDHEDAITLPRGEVIMLLEGLKRGHIA